MSLHRSTDAQCALHATYVHCCTLHTKYYTLLHPAHIATNCWLCNVLENAASCPEGYAAGHCPYLDQCVFTHMDAADILDWIKVGQGRRRAGEGKEGVGRSRIWVRVTQSGAGVEAWTWEGAGAGARAGPGAGPGAGAGAGAKHFQEDFLRHYTTNKAPYTLAMHTNWFQEQSQVMNALCSTKLYFTLMSFTELSYFRLTNIFKYKTNVTFKILWNYVKKPQRGHVCENRIAFLTCLVFVMLDYILDIYWVCT